MEVTSAAAVVAAAIGLEEEVSKDEAVLEKTQRCFLASCASQCGFSANEQNCISLQKSHNTYFKVAILVEYFLDHFGPF